MRTGRPAGHGQAARARSEGGLTGTKEGEGAVSGYGGEDNASAQRRTLFALPALVLHRPVALLALKLALLARRPLVAVRPLTLPARLARAVRVAAAVAPALAVGAVGLATVAVPVLFVGPLAILTLGPPSPALLGVRDGILLSALALTAPAPPAGLLFVVLIGRVLARRAPVGRRLVRGGMV
jgi:hypothetical protein